MNSPSREYLYLYHTMVCANEDMQNLQAWITTVCDSTKLNYRRGEADIAAKTLHETIRQLERRLQHVQLLLIEARQKAEEIRRDFKD